jgi:hypothetical protein
LGRCKKLKAFYYNKYGDKLSQKLISDWGKLGDHFGMLKTIEHWLVRSGR